MMRVAAYCRVSTEQEDQQHSFASQQQYFESYIEAHPGWILHSIYADDTDILGLNRTLSTGV